MPACSTWLEKIFPAMKPEPDLQQALLTAAFADREDALLAWRSWEQGSDWQTHVDFDSYLLLPRVYHNLGSGSVDDALFSRLKGIIRQNWVANTRRLVMLRKLAEGHSLAPQQLLLLPPISLISQDRSSAFANDAPGLWLRDSRLLRQLVADLFQGGWCTPGRHIPGWCLGGFSAAASSLDLVHPEHGQLRLLWSTRQDACTEAWHPRGGSAQVYLGDSRWHTLLPEDTVRYLLLAPDQGLTFRRCARALLYLQSTGDISGWQFLLRQLQPGPLLDTARKLAPPGAVAPGGSTAAPAQGISTATPPVRLPFFHKQRQHWSGFRADLGADTGTFSALCSLPGYLMGKWGLSHPGQIPGRLLRGLRSDVQHRPVA